MGDDDIFVDFYMLAFVYWCLLHSFNAKSFGGFYYFPTDFEIKQALQLLYFITKNSTSSYLRAAILTMFIFRRPLFMFDLKSQVHYLNAHFTVYVYRFSLLVEV